MSKLHLQRGIQGTLKEILISLIAGGNAEQLDIHDNFFDLGLDSIAFVEIKGAIQEKLGVNISLRSMLEHNSTIANLSEYIADKITEAGQVSKLGVLTESPNKQVNPGQVAKVQRSQIQDSNVSTELTRNGTLPQITDVSSPQTAVERIVSQQLQLMSKQLELLRHNSSRYISAQKPQPFLIASEQKQKIESQSIKPNHNITELNSAVSVKTRDFIATPTSIATRLQSEVGSIVVENQQLQYYVAEILPKLEQVSLNFIIRALRNIGWCYQAGESVTLDEVAIKLRVAPRHQRLLQRLLQILSLEGILKSTLGRWVVLQSLPMSDDSISKYTLVLKNLPEWKLLYRCGSKLDSVLRGETEPEQLVFPAWDTNLVAQIYQESQWARVFNMLIQRVVSMAVANAPQQRELQILEIGAGTGGTTSYLLPHLSKVRTSYCFTDVGELFLELARERFSNYQFVKYQALNIEQEPIHQGFEIHAQDVVIAANVLHATQNIKQTLANVKQLLAPGGILVLLEGTYRQRWVDLIFGLLDGWWRFAEKDVELRPDHPLINRKQWLQVLQESGFDSVSFLPNEDNNLSQVAIIAQISQSARSNLVSKPQIQSRETTELTAQQQKHLDSLIARVVKRTQESKRLTQAARKVLANPRATKWFEPSLKEMLYPLHIQRGSGARIWDVDGNEYLDLTMGFGPLLFGHSPTFVIEAIQEHIQRGLQNGPQSHLISKVAKLMCELTGQERVCFCNSGTEAIMGAIRIARAKTGRTKIAFFANSYHGHSDELLVGKIARQDGTSHTVPAFIGIPKHKAEQVIMLDYGSSKSLEIIQAHAHELAAVLVEPIQSRKPGLQPQEFLHQLRQLTLETGVVLILDEVITGFRMHPRGIQGLWGIQADLTAYGKALGAGLPVGAVAGKSCLMDLLDGGFWSYGNESTPSADVTFFAGTFFKNPLVMSVVWAVLSHIKDRGVQLQTELSQKTKFLADHLNDYFKQKQLPIKVVYFGSLFRFTAPKNLWLNLLFYHLLEKGIYVAEVRNMLLSTAHTDEDIEQIIQAVKASVVELQAGNFLPSSPSIGNKQNQEKPKKIQLTQFQKAVWLASKVSEGASQAYNESVAIDLQGQLNLEAITSAIQELVTRHEALRITFSSEGNYQNIASSFNLELPLKDLSKLNCGLHDAEISQLLAQEAGKKFNFEVGPLYRFLLVKLSSERHILVLTFHHLIVDGWSLGILLRELGVIYSAQYQKFSYELPKPIQYSEYVRRLKLQSKSSAMITAEAYWLRQFADAVPLLNLPTDRQRPAVNRYEGDRQILKLDESLCTRLKNLSGKSQCTLFTTLLAGFSVLLYQLSDLDDVVVGIPTAGQLTADCEYLVGHCANLLPLRMKVDAELKFIEYLSAVKKVLLDGYEHQIYPFINLSQKLQLTRNLSQTTFVEVLFNLDRVITKPKLWGLKVKLTPNHGKRAKFDLVFDVTQTDRELMVMCDYNSNIFDSHTIRLWLEQFQTLLLYATTNPDTPLSQFPSLTEVKTEALQLSAQQILLGSSFEESSAVDTSSNLDDSSSERLANTVQEPQETKITRLKTPEQEIIQGIWCEILGLEWIDRHEDFFEIGGHSLRATQVLSRIRKALSIELPLSTMFEARTIAELSNRIIAARCTSIDILPQIFPTLQENDFPLSFAQGRLWFLNNFTLGDPAYNIAIAYRLEGCLNEDVLEEALNAIVKRQESLRTNFIVIDGSPRQKILEAVTVKLNIIDLTDTIDTEIQSTIEKIAKTEYLWRFELNGGPLFRFTLVRLSPEKRIFFVNMHHIIADGWSIGVFNRELSCYYQAIIKAESCHLRKLPIRYADFAVGQREWLQGEVRENQLAYWRERLAGLVPLQLPQDYSRPEVQTFVGKTVDFHLSSQITTSVERLSRDRGVTLFMTLVAAFFVLLYRYSGQEDLAIATPIANRNRGETEHLIGFFVNTLILRCPIDRDMSFTELLQQVRQISLSAYDRQDFPFEQVVEALAPERDSSQNPLVQVIFALQNAPMEPPTLPGLDVKLASFEEYTTRFDLEVHLFQVEDGLTGDIIYNSDLFESSTIVGLKNHFITLLQSVSVDPNQSIQQLSILEMAEQKELIRAGRNNFPIPYPRQKTIHELFEIVVSKRSEAIAITYGQNNLSYQELNLKANQLARYLKTLNVKLETPIGIYLERGVDSIIAELAILKANACYVPLNPEDPLARVRSIIEDVDLNMVLTDSKFLERLPAKFEYTELQLVCLDRDREIITAQKESNLPLTTKSDNLCYVMYTSGSTGQPNGVRVIHRSVVRLVKKCNYVKLDETEVVLQLAPLTFDASTFEIWGALLNGSRLVIATPNRPTLEELGQLIQQKGVTTAWLTASLFHLMVDENIDGLRGLRQLLAGGDVLSPERVRQVLAYFDGSCMVINGYGPTENTTFTCCHSMKKVSDCDGESVPIGKPISNTYIYILDSKLQPVPDGVVGELYVGGDGLARDYNRRPELTAEKFIPDPFNHDSQKKIYRTKDLVRRRTDGTLEFVGRLDDQLKIRGFRIEPMEIQACLERYSLVRDSLVMTVESKNQEKIIVAYIVPTPNIVSISASKSNGKSLLEYQKANWAELFDCHLYSQTEFIDNEDPTFNLRGWIDSYTGKPIPQEQMREWLNYRIEQIMTYRPRHILELGVGTGLLLFQLAPVAERYVALDISQVGLDYIKTHLPAEELKKVELKLASADDIGEQYEQQFDTCLINSTVQYFPSVDYLILVLEKAIAATKPGGIVYVGDVRNLTTLECFHAAVALKRAEDNLTCQDLRHRVRQQVFHQNELLVDPRFFKALKQRCPRISQVKIQLQQGSAFNELTRHRYDVILQIEKTLTTVLDYSVELNWYHDSLSITALRARLESLNTDSLIVRDIPNARMMEDLLALSWLKEADESDTVAMGRVQVQNKIHQSQSGVNPHELVVLAKVMGLSSEISWAQTGAIEKFDATFYKVKVASKIPHSITNASSFSPFELSCMANLPLRSEIGTVLESKLQDYLREQLPEYMVPSYILTLSHFPLKPSGKVDRALLPQPIDSKIRRQKPISLPKQGMEQAIANIWQDILQLDTISREDNFFDVGGNSLTMVKACSILRETLNLDLTVVEMFQYSTVRKLAEYLKSNKTEVKQNSNLTNRAQKQKGAYRRQSLQKKHFPKK